MNRRNLLATTAAVTTAVLAGCTENGSANDEETDAEDSDGEGTDAESSELALDHLETVYDAWVRLDADAFLATLHSTNNHPEEEVRSSTSEIEFEGELVALDAEVESGNLGEDAISTFFESGANLSDQDVSTFIDARTIKATVDPTVEGETANETQENLKSFFETEKSHLLAVENGEWRFVL